MGGNLNLYHVCGWEFEIEISNHTCPSASLIHPNYCSMGEFQCETWNSSSFKMHLECNIMFILEWKSWRRKSPALESDKLYLKYICTAYIRGDCIVLRIIDEYLNDDNGSVYDKNKRVEQA